MGWEGEAHILDAIRHTPSTYNVQDSMASAEADKDITLNQA